MEIRGESISYAAYKKNHQTNEETKLSEEIQLLTTYSVQNVNLIEKKQKELQEK